ncbi:ATP-binding protein [Variovorax saccharolyticus]|uniref:ATP-binding protein n=1 Tax=Variovorax saccharolyticus TaxID=3053516 RepID=UPI00257899C6|nr:ATP-binding protein [Variovorax sp. J31P216]MDM0026724.1 ATP-binding protein [Variovorax sp. J31P216]
MSPSGGQPQASLIVGSELRELSRVSAWVQDWAEGQHLPARLAMSLDLCSTEVVTNIMTHASGQGAAPSILLRLGWQDGDVALEVEDEGSEFDPRQAAEPEPATSLEDARVGGWGIPIVRRFSDGLQYRHRDGRNCLTLLFRATAPP